ncbi:MAG: GAF domain-containing protein [Kofleriaceae bacterium]|jgi:signal transduction histidine kinase|nr:GAF domain-containing protein [Kofleriaceae bacterium]MBP6840529.1 GAF domain-containing protein [Kofleriaceae bacterium]MBP9204278.1 GAF domain-containing protein [Kofleriaceae bacterium]
MATPVDTTPASVADLAARLAREQKKLALVGEVSRALSSALPLDQLLVVIMEKVTQLMDADRSTLYLMSRDRTELWSKVVQGGEVVDIRLKVGEGVAGWVGATGETVNLIDAYDDQRFQPAVDLRSGYRTRSVLAVPMRDTLGAIVGVLQVLNKQDGPFTGADEELLDGLASQAAMAIENATLYHSVVAQNAELVRARGELEQMARELNALYEVEKELSAAVDLDELLTRILTQAVAVLRVSAGSIALVDGGQLRFGTVVGPAAARLLGHSMPIGEGVIGWAVARRAPLVVNQPADDPRHAVDFARSLEVRPRNILAAPLVDGDEVLGGVELIDKAAGAGFDQDDVKLLVLVAAQIAKAIGLAKSRDARTHQDRLAAVGRLVAGILHDLRTPMTIISGYAQLMAASDDAAQRDRYVELVLRQFDLMSGMTREVLAFARGDADLFVRKVYLHVFLDEVGTQLRAAMAGRGVEVTIEPGYDGVAYFDEQKFLRVIHNLARNAAEAMTSGGAITVRTSRDGEHLVLSIVDNGPGIPAEVQGRLFTLFASGKRGGTGLGLAIVKKIVEDHGGSVAWSSGSSGTSFHLRVPLDGRRAGEAVDPATTLPG